MSRDTTNPERPSEAEKVAATRAVIERLYYDGNQGCRPRMSHAITWLFEQVEEAIILENDCVSHPDLFPYCTTLLELSPRHAGVEH